jgi:hypothetical protein
LNKQKSRIEMFLFSSFWKPFQPLIHTFWHSRYNTLTNEWTYVAPMTIARSHFSTTVCKNRIFCLGGHDSIHYLNTVEKFNPGVNRWHCMHAMQVRRFGAGAATLFVPLYK